MPLPSAAHLRSLLQNPIPVVERKADVWTVHHVAGCTVECQQLLDHRQQTLHAARVGHADTSVLLDSFTFSPCTSDE
jgi:hypothetical protein